MPKVGLFKFSLLEFRFPDIFQTGSGKLEKNSLKISKTVSANGKQKAVA
jgi:hypothetical protein